MPRKAVEAACGAGGGKFLMVSWPGAYLTVLPDPSEPVAPTGRRGRSDGLRGDEQPTVGLRALRARLPRGQPPLR